MNTLIRRVKQDTIRDARIYDATIQNLNVGVRLSRSTEGNLTEVYIVADKQGTLINGFLDTISRMMSKMLQYGIPTLEVAQICRGQMFEPKGFVKGNPDIMKCDSIVDYVAQLIMVEEESRM